MGGLVDTWDQADARCRVAGGTLPSVANRAENDLFRDLLLQRGLGRSWLGATDRQHEYNFSWVDGSAGPGTKTDQFFDNWYGNQPDEGGPNPFRCPPCLPSALPPPPLFALCLLVVPCMTLQLTLLCCGHRQRGLH